MLYLGLCLVPFVMISIFNAIYQRSFHVLPVFSSDCDSELAAMVFWISLHLLEVLLLLTTIYFIRLVWRAFSVKQELTWVVVLDVIFCACMLGFDANTSNSNGSDGPNDGVLTLYCVMMRSVGLFIISIMWPLYRSYFPITLPEIPSQDVITSLQAILDDVEATVQFRRFMTEQDAQYLLDCWMEIDLFKDAWHNNETEYRSNIDKGNNEALKIYLKYFDVNNNSNAALGVRNIVSNYFCKSMKKIFDKILLQKEQRELRLKLRKKRREKKSTKHRNKHKQHKLSGTNNNNINNINDNNGNNNSLNDLNDPNSPQTPRNGNILINNDASGAFGGPTSATSVGAATTPTAASSVVTSSFDDSLSAVLKPQSQTRNDSLSLGTDGSLMHEIESEELMRVESNVFDYPQTLLFNHMENLHYRLFLRSEYCKKLLRNLQTKEAFFRQLINEEIL